MDNSMAVVIVGAGGIGSALFQDLARFLPHTIDIHLMDGDSVEGRNLQRQMFSRHDRDRNKAEALAEKATTALGLDRVYHHGAYLTSTEQVDAIAKHYGGGVILVGCVDNHPARRHMEAWVRMAAMPAYYVDCANELDRGEVVAVYSDGNRVFGSFRSEVDPAVLTDDSGDPTKVSCSQHLDAGNRQVLYTNRTAAVLALKLISHFLDGNVRTGIVYFSDVHIDRLKGVAPGGHPEMAASL